MELSKAAAFDQAVSTLFGHLVTTFPQPVGIDATAAGLTKQSGYKVDENSGFGELVEVPAHQDEVFFVGCVTWLEAEGYIHAKREGFSFVNVVLTAKGLKLLRVEPRCLNTNIY